MLRSNCVKTGSLKNCCFLKGGQKVGKQDLEAPGAQKQLCNDRLLKKSGWPEHGKSGLGATMGAKKQLSKDRLF